MWMSLPRPQLHAFSDLVGHWCSECTTAQKPHASPVRWSSILTPSRPPHALLHLIPNPLDDLPIPPAPIRTLLRIPLFHPRAHHPSPPSLDTARDFIAPPPDVDTESVPKQFRCALPLVRFELPRLPCGEDGDDAGPIVRFELLWGID